jgi:hypothetical protein
MVARFAQALEYYRAVRFAQAIAIWDELAAEETGSQNDGANEPTRGPAAAMAARSREFMANPPGQPWQAVHVLMIR